MENLIANLDGKHVSVQGINIRYAVNGLGHPVLLAHGFGEFMEVWWQNIEPLSQYYQVYVMDLPGHGLSGETKMDYTIPFLTEFMLDFMQILNIESAHLIGHSMGATLGLNMAINFPNKVDRLILVASGGLTTEVPPLYRLCTLPIIGDIMVRPTIKPIMKHRMKKAFYNPDVITEQMVDINYELIKRPETKRTMLSIIRNNADLSGPRPDSILIDKLHLVKAFTLFIHGEQDPVVALADVQRACNLIPNASLRVIPESGHCPFIEKAIEFNEAAIAFLQSNN